MKIAWNMISFLAVVNLLALSMFIAWMWHTERLDAQRVEELRAMLAMTIPEAEAAAARAAEDEALAAQQQAEAARRETPGVPAANRIRDLTSARKVEQRSVRRIDDVKALLSRQMGLQEAEIEEQRSALEAQRQALVGGLGSESERRAEDQLKKVVKLLESLPPKQTKKEIVELVTSGKKDQAVLYLDAMSTRARGKVFAEFKTDQEIKLAAELLERIRTLGQPDGQAGAETDSSNADASADTR